MRIRVYITADIKSSVLFENIDNVRDGTDSAVDSQQKLVLLRRVKKTNSTGQTYEVTETVAVFKHWTFWKLVS
jgi:hypothetical protein